MKRLLAVALLVGVAGCGDPAKDFVETWTFGAGSNISLTCPGQGVQTLPIQNSVLTITEVDSGKIHGVDATGCALDYTVSGSTATLPANSSCTVTGIAAGTQTFTSGSLVLSNNNNTLTAAAAGSFLATGVPAAGACTLTLSGTLTHT